MGVTVWPFVAAGCLGVFVAVFHGIVTQKRMIVPILRDTDLPDSTRRLVPLLLQFSTICWLMGGLALIIGPYYVNAPAMLTIAAFVCIFYSIGAIGNFWGTRGKHPGWILLLAATALIVYGGAPLLA